MQPPVFSEDEKIIKKDQTMLVKSIFQSLSGFLILSEKRLMFTKDDVLEKMFGPQIFKQFKSGAILMDLPLSEIKEYKQGKHMINTNVLEVTDKQGKQHKFVLTAKYAEWEAELKKLIPA